MGKIKCKFMDALKNKYSICISEMLVMSGEPLIWYVNQEFNVYGEKGCCWSLSPRGILFFDLNLETSFASDMSSFLWSVSGKCPLFL
jgi:hypothetical protein